ncbi:MAG: glycosyltransferase family 39 protein [Pseudomonadota bacterium]
MNLSPRIRSFLEAHGATCLVVAWALLVWGLQALWLCWDHGPPVSDEWLHLTKAELLQRGLREGGLSGLLDAVSSLDTVYPPLVFLLAQPAFLLAGGFSTLAANLSIGPWLVVLVCATYGIGRRTVGTWPGVLAAVVVPALPLLLSLSRKFLLDFPLAAAVAATAWALLASDRLRKPAWVWLSGLLLGLALLTKFIAGVFVLGMYAYLVLPPLSRALRRWPIPWLILAVLGGLELAWLGRELHSWYLTTSGPMRHQVAGHGHNLVRALLDSQHLDPRWHLLGLASIVVVVVALRMRDPELRALVGVAAAVLAAAWLAGCWYLPQARIVVLRVGQLNSAAGLAEGDPGPSSMAGWLYYPWALTRAMPAAWSALVAGGLLVSLALPRLRRGLGPVLASMAVAFVIINLSSNKELRYAASVSPFLAVVAVGWLGSLPSVGRHLIQGVVVAMALCLLTSWIPVAAGWWTPSPDKVWRLDRVMASAGTITGFFLPDHLDPRELLTLPRFYVVAPLPRDLPYEDRDLPFGITGP